MIETIRPARVIKLFDYKRYICISLIIGLEVLNLKMLYRLPLTDRMEMLLKYFFNNQHYSEKP
ncbi:hypothetical protein CVS40_6783 [Lucilia cuprina]|nr:hypothetical protein CVS40_6783 [Lucilia cuprina]